MREVSRTVGNWQHGLALSRVSTQAEVNPLFWVSANAVTCNLRTLLIHGARAAILAAKRHAKENPWLSNLLKRSNPNVAAVALANKNACTIWALLAHDREFRADYIPRLANA